MALANDMLTECFDGQNRPLPIASIHSAMPRGMNVMRMNVNHAIQTTQNNEHGVHKEHFSVLGGDMTADER